MTKHFKRKQETNTEESNLGNSTTTPVGKEIEKIKANILRIRRLREFKEDERDKSLWWTLFRFIGLIIALIPAYLRYHKELTEYLLKLFDIK
jgi:hypothetical protein